MTTPETTAHAVTPARRSLRATAARYLGVGLGAVVIDIGILALLHDVMGVALAVSTPAAFLTSFVVTYLLQRAFTFQTAAAHGPAFVRYALLVGANTLAVTLIVTAVVGLGGPWIVGKLVAVAMTTVWNFFLYRHWIFPAASGSSAIRAEQV